MIPRVYRNPNEKRSLWPRIHWPSVGNRCGHELEDRERFSGIHIWYCWWSVVLEQWWRLDTLWAASSESPPHPPSSSPPMANDYLWRRRNKKASPPHSAAAGNWEMWANSGHSRTMAVTTTVSHWNCCWKNWQQGGNLNGFIYSIHNNRKEGKRWRDNQSIWKMEDGIYGGIMMMMKFIPVIIIIGDGGDGVCVLDTTVALQWLEIIVGLLYRFIERLFICCCCCCCSRAHQCCWAIINCH